MPNWCSNKVILSGSESQLKKVREAISEGKLFQTFVPVESADAMQQKAAWGTKWDMEEGDYHIEEISDNEISIRFDTAWTPPIGVYRAMTDDGFDVEAMYAEPGNAIAGRWSSALGEIEFNYSDYSEIEDDDLREEFGLYAEDE